MNSEAYKQGFANGQADKLFGYGSRYAKVSFSTDPDYVRSYSSGYNDGQLDAIKRIEDHLKNAKPKTYEVFDRHGKPVRVTIPED